MRTLLDTVVRLTDRPAKPQPQYFSLIDFGSDTVKAVVVRKEKTGVRILGYGFAPAEDHELSGGRASVVALAAIADGALMAAEDQTEGVGQGKFVPDKALFCIPAHLTRGECFTVRQTRSDPAAPIAIKELTSVWERVERLARERLPLLGEDRIGWKPLAITPGTIMLDGHRVTDPIGLKGRELSLSAFGVAVWPSALRAAEAVAERLELDLVNVVAMPQSLASMVPQREAILLDIGARGTGLHLIQHDALVSTVWWPQGGQFFTQCLAQTFRCSWEEAEALKRAYADAALSEQDNRLVAQSLVEPIAAWMEALTARLRQMSKDETARRLGAAALEPSRGVSLPGRIYLTGGGSLLLDLSRALSSLEVIPGLGFRRSLEIEPLGTRLGVQVSGNLALLDMPPPPLSELLAPVTSMATCLEQ